MHVYKSKFKGLLLFPCSECHSDGTHTCFINYTVDADNQLSDEQLENLKNNLIQVFKLQHNQQTVGVQQIKMISMDSPFEGILKDHACDSHAHTMAILYTSSPIE